MLYYRLDKKTIVLNITKVHLGKPLCKKGSKYVLIIIVNKISAKNTNIWILFLIIFFKPRILSNIFTAPLLPFHPQLIVDNTRNTEGRSVVSFILSYYSTPMLLTYIIRCINTPTTNIIHQMYRYFNSKLSPNCNFWNKMYMNNITGGILWKKKI